MKALVTCRSIYFSMLDGHLSQGFEPDVAKLSAKLVDATIELHRHVMNNFLPSAVKFHYQFNLRELSNITQASLLLSHHHICRRKRCIAWHLRHSEIL